MRLAAATLLVVAVCCAAQDPLGFHRCCAFKVDKPAAWTADLDSTFPTSSYPDCGWTREGLHHKLAYGSSDLFAVLSYTCYGADPEGQNWRHHLDVVLRLDRTTGQILKSKSWADLSAPQVVSGSETELFVVAQGRLLLHVGKVLKVLSEDLDELTTRDFEVPASSDGNFHAYVSPSGKVVLFQFVEIRPERKGVSYWLKVDDLSTFAKETWLPPNPFFAIDDDGAYYLPDSRSFLRYPRDFAGLPAEQKRDASVHFHARGTATDRAVCDDCYGLVKEVLPAKRLLIDKGFPYGFEVRDAGGKLLSQAIGHWPGNVTASQDGTVVAYWTPAAAQYELTLVDPDSGKRTWSATVKVKPLVSGPGTRYEPPYVAISQGPKQVAILVGSHVAAYNTELSRK